MLSSLLITLREGLEAALLIGLLLAVLTRTGDGRGARWVWLGVAAAAAASAAAGAVLFTTGAALEGTAEEAFEAGAMLAAAAVLGWMIVWMSRHAAALRHSVDGRVAAAAGSAAALFWLAFVLVAREGFETALFLFAAIGEERDGAALIGGLAGLALAAGVGYAVYRGGSRLNIRTFFTVLNVLLLGFGAYLVWGGLGELGEIAGGELGEVAGPIGAALYAGGLLWLLFRGRSTGAAAAA
jgi:high-affinity iron transporter